MSPSEFDLRGALHDGEGEGIDVEALIGHAGAVRRAQHARRVRWATTAAVIAVASGIGTTLAVVNDTSPTKSTASAGTAGRAAGSATAPQHQASLPSAASGGLAMGPLQPAPSADDNVGSGAVAGAGPGYSTTTTCASTIPKPPAPTLSERSSARLLPASVTSMVVCGYDGTGKLAHLPDRTEVSTTFTGADAQAITNSLAAASATKPDEFCPNVEHQIRTLAIWAADSRGRTTFVVAVPYCGGSVTNGSVTRYDWAPPSQLTNLINAKEPFSR